MSSIREKIAEQLAELSPSVEAQVISTMTEREIDKRANAIVTVLDKASKLKNDLNKCRPDQIMYDTEGKKVSEGFSKAKLDERNKILAVIKKHDDAINKALEKQDFADVYNLAGGKDSKGSGEEGGGEAAE